MEDINKMTDEERAQHIEDLLNAAVKEENEQLKIKYRLQKEVNQVRN